MNRVAAFTGIRVRECGAIRDHSVSEVPVIAQCRNMVFGRDSCKTEIFAHFACCRNFGGDGRGLRGDGLIQDFEQRYKVGGLVLNAQSSGFEGGLLFWLEDIDYAIAMVRRESQDNNPPSNPLDCALR